MKQVKLLSWAISCLVALVSSIPAFAQIREVTYDDGFYMVADKKDALYTEITDINAADGSAVVARFNKDSVLISQRHYKIFLKGSSGRKIRHGVSKQWHENGQLKYKSLYSDGELQDTLFGYYDDGALRRIEVYGKGEMLKGELYAKDGTVLPYEPAEQMPEFVGGMEGLAQYLAKNIRVPRVAQRAGIEGVVVVSFVIREDGSMTDLEVIEPALPAMDAEAMRVVAGMPNWEPGREDGKPVPVLYTLPVRFRLK